MAVYRVARCDRCEKEVRFPGSEVVYTGFCTVKVTMSAEHGSYENGPRSLSLFMCVECLTAVEDKFDVLLEPDKKEGV